MYLKNTLTMYLRKERHFLHSREHSMGYLLSKTIGSFKPLYLMHMLIFCDLFWSSCNLSWTLAVWAPHCLDCFFSNHLQDYGIDFADENHPIKAFQCRCGSEVCRDKKHKRSVYIVLPCEADVNIYNILISIFGQ